MTSRSKNAVRGFETEIEKSREEANWKKAVELAQQLKTRSTQHESLAHFLIGEGKLEGYLEEYPPLKENFERAQRELSEARGYLTLATDDNGKKAGVALDAHLLLGKLNYACGSYDDALKHYKLAELNTLTEKELPVRSLRIVAESYAIKGLCLEASAANPAASRYKQAERDSEMIRSFELACDLTLLYLQRTHAAGARAGPTLETALQRAPILHMRAHRLHHALDRYREMLRAVESPPIQALRLTLARQLAEVLMRGVTGQVYRAPLAGVGAGAGAGAGSLPRRKDEPLAFSEGPWKPKKYAAINQFVPANEYEEVLLVLVVGEAMAVRDAVLSQSAEFAAARDHALRNALAVTDLLALAATRWGRRALILESLERAMKFSFGCRHVWRQRALATAAARPPAPAPRDPPLPGTAAYVSGVRATAVMRGALPLCKDDSALRLVAANTYYIMDWIEDGIEMSEEALRLEEISGGPLQARALLMLGIGYQAQAQKFFCRVEKEGAWAKALRALVRSVQLDDNDHLAFYHLALQYLLQGHLNEAMEAARACLWCWSESSGGLRICACLWSRAVAGARRPRALRAARLARDHYPAADWPLWAIAALQADWEGAEAALATGKELLSLLNADADSEYEHFTYTELDALSDCHTDRDAVSVVAGSRRVERALSSGASTASGARHRPAARAHARSHAWLTLADLCLRLGRVTAAAGCVAEAAALTPYSHLVFHTRGMVHAANSEWEEARLCFHNALAIRPTHVESMIHLGAAQYSLGWLRLAEKSLREACSLSPVCAEAWRRLALVLAALQEPMGAADAAARALSLLPHHAALLPPPV